VSGLFTPDHLGALGAIAIATAGLVVAARRRPGLWLRVLALVLVVAEVSWWVYLASGGGEPGQRAQPLPLQLCDVAVLVAAAALWTRDRLLVEVTYFWGLAGTLQALLTPDLPQNFPSYPYFQYYVVHGGVVASALLLVIGLGLHPRPRSALKVAGLTIGYVTLVGVVDLVTGSNYMYLSAKPPSPTLLDLLGPWPVYLFSATLIGLALFALLDAPFRLRPRAARIAPPTPLR